MIANPPWLEPVKAHLLRIMAAPHRRHKFDRLQAEIRQTRNTTTRSIDGSGLRFHVQFSVFSPTRATAKTVKMLETELDPWLIKELWRVGWDVASFSPYCYTDLNGGPCWTLSVGLRDHP